MLVLGVIAGFFISKAVGSRAIQQQQLQTGSGGISSASGAAGLRRGVNGEIAERLAAGRLLQWPDPASAAAQQLLQDPQARTDGGCCQAASTVRCPAVAAAATCSVPNQCA
jgi:hypothetical protein